MVIGIFQDKIFAYLDRKFFPYKYQIKDSNGGINSLKTLSLFDAIWDYAIILLTWIFIGIYLLFLFNEWSPFIGDVKPLTYLFGDALWTIHVVFGLILTYQMSTLYNKFIIKS